MIPKLERVEYIADYTIRIKFADGMEGEVDLVDELWGEVFEPLKNLEVFKAFRLDPELNTVVWPSGADLAPEFLYEKAAAGRVNEELESRSDRRAAEKALEEKGAIPWDTVKADLGL